MFTDSRIHGCLHLSSASSHQHQFTDSRVHGCLGQKKIRVIFSNIANVHGFTDVTDVFTCHQQLHINTSSHHSRIHGFTDVLGRKKIRVFFPTWSMFTGSRIHGFTDVLGRKKIKSFFSNLGSWTHGSCLSTFVFFSLVIAHRST